MCGTSRGANAARLRLQDIPHRTRYLRLLNDLGRRTYATQLAWLDHVERELGGDAATRP